MISIRIFLQLVSLRSQRVVYFSTTSTPPCNLIFYCNFLVPKYKKMKFTNYHKHKSVPLQNFSVPRPKNLRQRIMIPLLWFVCPNFYSWPMCSANFELCSTCFHFFKLESNIFLFEIFCDQVITFRLLV